MNKQHIGKKRWMIAVMLGIGVIIEYFDRTNISIAAKPLTEEFNLTPGEMGLLLSSFAWSYALLQIPVGVLLDKIGVKWMMRLGTVIWSLATLMTAVVSGYGLVLLSRVLLGAGEAPYLPAAAKATGHWFPRKERGLAISMFDSESKLSNAIGTPIVALAVSAWGWRGGFFMTATLSILFAIVFWIWYRDPHEDKRLSKEEYDYIVEGGAQSTESAPGGTMKNIKYLLTKRKVWGIFIGFAAYGYSWFLFLTWLPGYLQTEMHMSVIQSGWYAAIPWIIGTLSEIIIGGWLIDHLTKKGYNPTRLRKTFLVIGMLLGLAVIGAVFTDSAKVAVFWISLALGGLVITSSIAFSIPTFIAPKGTVGTLTGLISFGNNAMGIAAPIVTGFIVGATGSFSSAFIVAGIFLIIGILSYVFLLTDLNPIESLDERESGNEQSGDDKNNIKISL
ncbi:MFS transporter [Scopulibacillus cellulosilyticus]|uniref:MFS transporter n=1 Tax=Scopulibacillus cellulosilyticus TaxID=2665665 RepID=A0ABW2Q1B1_9BACL